MAGALRKTMVYLGLSEEDPRRDRYDDYDAYDDQDRFEADAEEGTVIVGPVAFAPRAGAKPLGGRTTLQVINEGGVEQLVFPARVQVIKKKGRGKDGRFTGGTAEVAVPKAVRRATYLPRPFTEAARPAFEQKFAELVGELELK